MSALFACDNPLAGFLPGTADDCLVTFYGVNDCELTGFVVTALSVRSSFSFLSSSSSLFFTILVLIPIKPKLCPYFWLTDDTILVNLSLMFSIRPVVYADTGRVMPTSFLAYSVKSLSKRNSLRISNTLWVSCSFFWLSSYFASSFTFLSSNPIKSVIAINVNYHCIYQY